MKQALEPPNDLGEGYDVIFHDTQVVPVKGPDGRQRLGFSCQGRCRWFWITMSCWDCWWLVRWLKSVLVWSSASLKYTQCTVGWGQGVCTCVQSVIAWANGPQMSKWSMGWKVRSKNSQVGPPLAWWIALKKVFVCLGCVPCKFPTNYGWRALLFKQGTSTVTSHKHWGETFFISYHRFLLIVLTAYWFSGTTSTVATHSAKVKTFSILPVTYASVCLLYLTALWHWFFRYNLDLRSHLIISTLSFV